MANYDPTMEMPRTLRQMLGYGAFYGVFFTMGSFITWFTLWYFLLWQLWRINNVFVETTGVVIDKRVIEGEFGPSRFVQVRYRADDRERQNWNRIGGHPYLPDFEAIKVGDQRRVWFDPEKPDDVIVNRGYALLWWAFYPMLALGLLLTICSAHTIFRGVAAWLSAK